MDIFEQASRLKLRFPSPLGTLSTEDLWHLPLTSTTGKANLNDIGKALNYEGAAVGMLGVFGLSNVALSLLKCTLTNVEFLRRR